MMFMKFHQIENKELDLKNHEYCIQSEFWGISVSQKKHRIHSIYEFHFANEKSSEFTLLKNRFLEPLRFYSGVFWSMAPKRHQKLVEMDQRLMNDLSKNHLE